MLGLAAIRYAEALGWACRFRGGSHACSAAILQSRASSGADLCLPSGCPLTLPIGVAIEPHDARAKPSSSTVVARALLLTEQPLHLREKTRVLRSGCSEQRFPQFVRE